MRQRKNKAISFFLIMLVCPVTYTIDNAHFYRAPFFFGEPRFEKKGLSSFDFAIAGGSTDKARNSDGQTTCLLNIYGLHNMHKLGSNVPYKDKNNPADLTLILLSRITGRNNFGQLLFKGKFSTVEAPLMFTQNFKCGFFVQFYVPIRKLGLCNICSEDQSPTDDVCPNRNTFEWQAFLNFFDTILQNYYLTIKNYKKTDAGDTTLLAGWTCNYEETEVLDFLDLTIKGGLLVPTGREKNENEPFDIPSGYNGHVGFPLRVDGALGSYDWLTIGGHLGMLLFGAKTKDIRMKTDTRQNGFIKLAHGRARIDKGTIWEAGAYVKADHAARGLSLVIGYTFMNKYDDKITPCNTTIFDTATVNSDELFKGWNMHTVHFIAEYDFTKENKCLGPRVGIFYNLQVGGKRVFKTSMAGGMFGLDIAYSFN